MLSSASKHLHVAGHLAAVLCKIIKVWSFPFMEFRLCPLSSYSHVYTYRNVHQQTPVINPTDKKVDFKGRESVILCWLLRILFEEQIGRILKM